MIRRVTTGTLCAGLSSMSGIIRRASTSVEGICRAARGVDAAMPAFLFCPSRRESASTATIRPASEAVISQCPRAANHAARSSPSTENPMSNATPVTDANFETEVLKSGTPVLVDFWAPWCGPCRAVAPIVEAIAQEFDGKVKVAKLNTDEEQEIAIKNGVGSITAPMVVKNGGRGQRVVGERPEAPRAA